MTIKKLKKMPYAQAQVRIYTDENGNIYKTVLQSYKTDVIIIDKYGWVRCTGTYSNTTRRHISAFCKEYLPFDYYTMKQCYFDDCVINKVTGEVIPISNWEKRFSY